MRLISINLLDIKRKNTALVRLAPGILLPPNNSALDQDPKKRPRSALDLRERPLNQKAGLLTICRSAPPSRSLLQLGDAGEGEYRNFLIIHQGNP
jgi:hypothetical protein